VKTPLNLIAILLLISSFSAAQQAISDFSKLKGPYLGQTPPGFEPELFAPGIISTNNTEWTLTFMPDGNEAYYTIRGLNGYNHLICVKSVNGEWQNPEIASFSNPDHHADPFITPDGKRLFSGRMELMAITAIYGMLIELETIGASLFDLIH